MFFDLAPKTSKKDLYNFERELEELYRLYKSARIIAIVGPRRVGKTSLMLTFLNEYGIPYVYTDCRRVSFSSYGASFRGFAEELSYAISSFMGRYRGFADRLARILSGVRGVEVDISLARVFLRWRRRDRFNLAMLLDKLNSFAADEGIKLVLVFDELQELSQLNVDFPKLLAYVYDHLSNIVVIVSGSQVGLLYDVLGVYDVESPLYGRVVAEVRIGRLPRDKAIDFLEKGFTEAGVSVSREVVEKAVDIFDGVIGWLTYFGWCYIYKVQDVEAIADMAARQEAEEIKRFLSKTRSEKRYREILKVVAQRPSRWAEIKRALEIAEGVEIDDKNFNQLLQKLVKAGFIERRDEYYVTPDVVTSIAIRNYL